MMMMKVMSWGEILPLLPTRLPRSDFVRASFQNILSFSNDSERPSNEERDRNDRNEDRKCRRLPIVRPSFSTVRPSFPKHCGSFRLRSCRSLERGPSVVPSRSEMKRPCNERYFLFWVVPSQKFSRVSWDETTPE